MNDFREKLCNLVSSSQGLNQLVRLYSRAKDRNDVGECRLIARRIHICYKKIKEDWAEFVAVADSTNFEDQ